MSKRGAAVFDDAEEAEFRGIVESPVSNALRFTLMRAVRLVLTLACEAVAFFGCVMFGVFGFLTACWAGCFALLLVGAFACTLVGDTNWSWTNDNYYWREFALKPGQVPAYPLYYHAGKHPYLVAVPAFILMTVAWAQALALGVPYRWKNLPPGAGVVKCEDCGAKIVDRLNCRECHSFRPKYIVMQLIWVGNAALTSLWVMHDAVFGFVGFARGK